MIFDDFLYDFLECGQICYQLSKLKGEVNLGDCYFRPIHHNPLDPEVETSKQNHVPGTMHLVKQKLEKPRKEKHILKQTAVLICIICSGNTHEVLQITMCEFSKDATC